MTPFIKVYEKFYEKIKKNIDFFQYDNMTEEEISAIIEQRSFGLMEDAIAELLGQCTPDVNFYDYDEKVSCFNFELTKVEIDLITDLMMMKLAEESKAEMKMLEVWFNPKEISTFSPANERKTFLDMLSAMSDDIKNKIQMYNAKDRITGKYKTLNYRFGD